MASRKSTKTAAKTSEKQRPAKNKKANRARSKHLQNVDQVGPDDLVLVADSGEIYVVTMQQDSDGNHEPVSVGTLDPSQQEVPSTLRDSGVTFAILPNYEEGMSGGVTCYLLNLQSVVGALHPAVNPAVKLPMRLAHALQNGGTVTVKDQKGKEETFDLPTPKK